jgi:dUTPase
MDPAAPDLELPCKIAQLIVRRVEEVPPIRVVFDMDEATARGAGGFGSSDAA